MSAFAVFLLVVGVLFVGGVACCVAVAVWAGRKIAHVGRRASWQVRRGHASVRASVPGAARPENLERARVAREWARTLEAYDLARRSRRPVAELAPHVAVLDRTGRCLDWELSATAADTATARRDTRFAELRTRVDLYVRACSDLRQSVAFADDIAVDAALTATARDLADRAEFAALRAEAHRELTR